MARAQGRTSQSAATETRPALDPVLHRLAEEIAAYERVISALPVTANVSPNEIRERLAAYDFAVPIPLDQLIDEVATLLRRWSLHVSHPRYFGLFNPTVRWAGVAAETLVALYNPQLAAWPHAPIANEIERHLLSAFMRLFGMDPSTCFANFTTVGRRPTRPPSPLP